MTSAFNAARAPVAGSPTRLVSDIQLVPSHDVSPTRANALLEKPSPEAWKVVADADPMPATLDLGASPRRAAASSVTTCVMLPIDKPAVRVIM